MKSTACRATNGTTPATNALGHTSDDWMSSTKYGDMAVHGAAAEIQRNSIT
jgi:hypothetical protein